MEEIATWHFFVIPSSASAPFHASLPWASCWKIGKFWYGRATTGNCCRYGIGWQIGIVKIHAWDILCNWGFPHSCFVRASFEHHLFLGNIPHSPTPMEYAFPDSFIGGDLGLCHTRRTLSIGGSCGHYAHGIWCFVNCESHSTSFERPCFSGSHHAVFQSFNVVGC